MLVLALTTSCGGTEEPEPERSAEPESASAERADPWAGRIKAWERENAIASSSWYGLVKEREVVAGLNLLDVTTKIVNDGDAARAAAPICGGYATITFEYPKLKVVRILARDGGLLAKCGPGA